MYETLLLISQAVKSGVPLSTAIRLSLGTQPPRGSKAFLRLATLLDQGIEPKVAAAQSGLPASVVDLLDTAFSSGDFAGTFDELAKLEVSRSLAIHRVVQALAYPSLLLFTAVWTFAVILISTVPQYEKIFIDFDTNLPPATVGVIMLSQLVRSPIFLLGFVALAVVLYVAIKFLFPRFWFCVPVFGSIGRCLYTMRMLRQMANQVARNVPLPDALEQCGKTMRNRAYRKDCRAAAESARRGMPFWEIALRYYWLFPAWLAPMLAADNVQESLSRSLRRAAETVDQQKDASILLLQVLSFPTYVIFMLLVVSGFVLAMFMPLVNLMTSLSA